MVVKTDICVFSGYKIYPGHGIRYVPVIASQTTRPVFSFLNPRCLVYYLRGKNPRDLTWTTFYRKNHKKGIVEEYKKAKKKKAKKAEKSIVGASLEFIAAQKAQTDEQRKKIFEAARKVEQERKKKLNSLKQKATQKEVQKETKAKDAKAKDAKKQQQQQKKVPQAKQPQHQKIRQVGKK